MVTTRKLGEVDTLLADKVISGYKQHMLEERCVFLPKKVVLVSGKKVVCTNEKNLC